MGIVYSFGPFELESASRRLTRGREPVPIADRYVDVLLRLVSGAGTVVSKDALVEAAWRDVAVTDNSVEQAISIVRRTLGTAPDGQPYIQTVPRQGYRFVGIVNRTAERQTDAVLDALLAPHRAWIEGRAALESLERDQIVHARHAFERVLASAPEQASAHIGLANACVMQFEMTRTDEAPDRTALAKAAHHAREACRFDAQSGEAWATLGFVLDRTGNRTDALAAGRRAVTLEPDNWRHHFRLAYVSWGEERLSAARRTLSLLPGFPLAHWLAATVHVARQAFVEAERELGAGIAVLDDQGTSTSRFSAVALHWVLGLVHLARDDDERALEEFERELSFEGTGHLYTRECCANTWYAIGALRLRQGQPLEARAAFERAIERVTSHPMARIGLAHLRQGRVAWRPDKPAPPVGSPMANRLGGEPATGPDWHAVAQPGTASSVDAAFLEAARLALAGRPRDASRVVEAALASAAAGNAGWTLPVEPLLRVNVDSAVWAPALARLRTRAA